MAEAASSSDHLISEDGGVATNTDEGAGSRHPKSPQSFLVIFNVGKRQNWGTLMRSACAFGVSEIMIVGARKLATFGNKALLGTHAQATSRPSQK